MAHKVRRYAQDTKVSAGISKDEIERMLRKHGASNIYSGRDDDRQLIQFGFTLSGRMYKLSSSIARPATRRCDDVQIEREAWRVLKLLVTGRIAVVESGGATFESEFLGNLLLPDGSTVADDVLPKVAEAYATGQMRPLLGAGA